MSSHIAAVVNLHREGPAAIPSLVSAWRAVEHARQAGLDTQLVVLVDSGDAATIALAESWRIRGAQVLHAEVADLGDARNHAVRTVDARWMAFLDGDDLWGEQWLQRAFESAESDSGSTRVSSPTVWHPALNVIFGDHHSLLHHVDSNDSSFSWSRFRLHNQWTALSFVHRSVLLAIPFPRNDLESGFGFEDWSWNEEVLRRGGRHRIVPDTTHLIQRSSSPSLLQRSQRSLRTRYPPSPAAVYTRRHPPHASPGQQITTQTHRVAEVVFTGALREQVRLAATVEPRILQTYDPERPPASLPQNFQTHVTPGHVALDEVDRAAEISKTSASLAEVIDAVPSLLDLTLETRARVVAEVLLDPQLSSRRRGDSSLISEAVTQFPQLA